MTELVRRHDTRDAAEPVTALSGVTFSIAAGEAVAIVGVSGSGKSSLLNAIGAMDEPTSGSVVVDGIDVTRLGRSERSMFRRRIGVVFQQFHLLASLGALENVAAPLVPYTKARVARARARECLAEVGLGDRERALPGQLSGGQQQRVAIARAIVTNPVLLLADEPTGNLDAFTGRAILELLLGLREARSTTLVLVTHDPIVASCCDRVIHLHDGRIAAAPAVTPLSRAARRPERLTH
ncbi:MAG: ABC transporter ATP-binding protein [Acidimicrobiales bacterium]